MTLDPRSVRYTIDGQQCQFPATWNGEQVYDCVDFMGTALCIVVSGSSDERQWQSVAYKHEATAGQRA